MASRSIKNRSGVKKKQPFIAPLIVVTVFIAVVIAGGMGVYALGSSWIEDDLPDYQSMDEFNTAMPTEVFASDRTTQLAKFQLENREPVGLDQVSSYVTKGTIATEDMRFYEHGGFDMAGIARALVVNITGSGREGASTITQQLVRNTLLSAEMDDISIKRKVREMYLSVKLEEQYTKDEILRMYLNTINYGSGSYGIQAASQRYFSKNALDLTLAEAATLVGIPQSPTYNNPLDNLENCLARRNLVLERMLTNGSITQEQHDIAKAEAIALNPTEPSLDGIQQYPYFTSYVRDLLSDPDGPYKYTTNQVFKGGLKVITTLDPMTQDEAESAIAEKEATFTENIQGALVAIEPSTGHIYAMVGGNDWDSSKVNLATGDGTDPVNPGRPSGSAFKTFTLIAALEAGINPTTLIDCSSPATIPETSYKGTETLKNIDNINYGTRSIQRGFAVSSNTGFVRLEMSLGVSKVAEVAKRMGITSPLSELPTLTLGTENVTMLDMSSAYATIANQGLRIDPTPILQIYDGAGELLVDNTKPDTDLAVTHSKQVITPEVAAAAVKVMQTVVNSWEGTGTDAVLRSGQQVAAKTGTSSDYKDITFCGITPQMSVSIWFGEKTSSVSVPEHTGAGDVFRNFMSGILEGKPIEKFATAADIAYKPYADQKYNIGGYSGTGYGSGSYSGSSTYSDTRNRETSPSGTSNNNASGSEASSSNSKPDDSGAGGSGGTGGGTGDTGGSTGSETGGSGATGGATQPS